MQDNVSLIKDKINIVDLIGQYVPLKKTGKNHKGRCPFHNEKTPSFIVSEDIQHYRCFGCGKSGDIFNFIMDYEGVEFSEALKILADKAGVKIEYSNENKKEKGLNDKILEMNKIAEKFYSRILLEHKFGEPAKEYLKKRGITGETVKEFRIGYAPNSWDSLSNFLLKSGFTADEIEKAGLGKKRKSGNDTYDMFRGRLMFPLYDQMDRVVGFAGRALFPEQEPKYINTPETPLFHKEKFLFGINHAKAHIRSEKEAIIVEGEFDMISPYQAGYKNIVASKGTALTLGQIELLKRYAPAAILIFDNDAAGADASIRGIDIIKNAGINLKIAIMPSDVKDPDELIKKDPKALKEILKKAVPLWDYYFIYANQKFEMDDVFGKKAAGQFLLQMIKSIEDEVVKAQYIKKFVDAFDMDESEVRAQLLKVQKVNLNFVDQKRDETEDSNVTRDIGLAGYPQSEVYLLSLLFKGDKSNLPFYTNSIEEDLFTNDDLRALFVDLKKAADKKKRVDIKAFHDKMSDSQPELYSLFEKIYFSLEKLSENSDLIDSEEDLEDTESFDAEIASVIRRLNVNFLKRKLKELSKAIKQAEAMSDNDKIDAYQDQVKEYTRELAELS